MAASILVCTRSLDRAGTPGPGAARVPACAAASRKGGGGSAPLCALRSGSLEPLHYLACLGFLTRQMGMRQGHPVLERLRTVPEMEAGRSSAESPGARLSRPTLNSLPGETLAHTDAAPGAHSSNCTSRCPAVQSAKC